MPTERMEEVEVVICEQFTDRFSQGTDCDDCGREYDDHKGPAIRLRKVAPGSLTSARLRLADAAEADEMARLKYEASGDGDAEWRAACGTRMAFLEAMNVVRALRTARGEG